MKKLLGTLALVQLLSLARLGTPPCPPSAQTGLPYYATADFLPHWKPTSHQVGPLNFTDQNGARVTENDLDGKLTVVNFFFIGCGSICPTLMTNLQRVLPEFGPREEIQHFSVSVTPQLDGPQELLEYARARQLDQRWHLLHGSSEMVLGLAKTSLFCADDLRLSASGQEVLHTEKVFLLDRQRRIRGLYNGSLVLEVERLTRDIRRLSEQR